jgi:hypothetical protein
MGKHKVIETVANNEATPQSEKQANDNEKRDKTPEKRRRIHPIRSLARLILRTGSKNTNNNNIIQLSDQEEGRTCHGPSRWHNLFPILEPLFTIDPKLLFIEDHILRRPPALRRDSAFEVPRNIDELRQRVQNTCDCDECSPKLYKISSASTHGVVEDRRNHPPPIRGSYQARRDVGLGPLLNLRFHGTYESMTLIRHHTAWLDATFLHPSSRPTPAVLHLQSLLSTWSTHLTGSDMRRTISPSQLTTLFTHLNRVFFSSCVPPHNALLSAGFSFLPGDDTSCFGKSYFNPIVGTQILIHPTLYRGNTNTKELDTRLRNRIGTILHEMCHAFLKAYACRSCPMHDTCVGPSGHGRAWQVLAKKMEEVAGVVLGARVDMGRFPSLLRDVEGHGRLPSAHDLEVYGWGGGRGG